MALFDSIQSLVIARVVYDGAPEAGKTTNVRQICQAMAASRRGEYHSPGSSGPRTEFFDWLDFQGGYVHGYGMRCQIIGVPGQLSLQSRRDHLLKSADAVVFVADARGGKLDETRDKFATLNALLASARSANLPPVPIVVQANKQDEPDAIAPADLARELGLDPSVPVMGAKAMSGDGVVHSFILAMRLASDRIQVLLNLGAIEGAPANAEDPDALYRAMQKLEELPDGVELSIEEKIQRMQAAQSAVHTPALNAPPPDPVDPSALAIPRAGDIPAGYLWPTLKARSILAAINGAGKAMRNRHPAAWAPHEAAEFCSPNGWLVHTCDDWLADDAGESRARLLQMVKRCMAMDEWVPEGRTFVVARHGESWRLWMTSPDLPSVHEIADRAMRSDYTPYRLEALRTLQSLYDSIERTNSASSCSLHGDLRYLALQQGRPVCLGVPDLAAPRAPGEWREAALGAIIGDLNGLFSASRTTSLVEASHQAHLRGKVIDLLEQAASAGAGG